MWTRSELKEKAKAYVKRSYWPLVLVSLILAVITGGFSNGGNSGRDYSTDWSGGVDGGDIASRITGNITGIDWALVGGIMAIAAVFAVAVIAIAVIVSIFVLNPIEVGCRRYFIEAAYGEVTMKNISVLVMAFKDGKYGNIVKTMFLKGLYQFLWSLLRLYLDADFDPAYLELVTAVQSEEYYVNMMIAWYLATALAKQWEETIPYLEERRLSEWVHRKTIQKAVESYRITKEKKEYLRSLR